MSKKLLFGLIVISLLFLTLFQTGQCEIQSSLTNGWQIEDKGGFVTETGFLHLLLELQLRCSMKMAPQ
jgi:hypothetical protein